MTNKNGPRILTVDIETTPADVYTYSLFQKVIGIANVKRPSRILCLAAKWHGEKKITFLSEWEHGRDGMLSAIHELLDEADFVVGWNSQRFDVKWLYGEFLKEGLRPPSPHRNIDLMLQAKNNFRLLSNKLDWYAQELGIGQKVHHQGIGLWRAIMEETEDAEKAQRLMRRYNIQDVKLTEQIFDRMLPWLKGINHGLYTDEKVCINCGSTHLQSRGHATTNAGRYPRYQCQGCGKWQRGKRMEHSNDLRSIA